MGCQFSCSTLCLAPQNELLSLAHNARKKTTYFWGYPRVKTVSSLLWDQAPSPGPLFPMQLSWDMDDTDMDDVFPSAGLLASTSQGTGQPRE